MELGIQEKFKNGLEIPLDWISFTVFDIDHVNSVIQILGYDVTDFKKLPKGMNGYRSCLRHSAHAIFVLSDGNEGMGIHVDISGSSIMNTLSHFKHKNSVNTPFSSIAYEATSFDFTILIDFLNMISEHGHLTRLDLAIDDIGENYFCLQQLHDLFSTGSYVSKFRKWRELISNGDENKCIGHTIYFGSQNSDIMLRIYDKKLEQKVDYSWVRWEFQLRADRAISVAKLLTSDKTIASVAIGVLSNYLRIIKFDNPVKSRCSIHPIWKRFISDVERISIYHTPIPKTLVDMEHWLMKQVAPSFATVVAANGGDLEMAYKMLQSGSQRLNSYQKGLILEHSEDY